MDDLIPFAVFIVIALVNVVKFVFEKNAKAKPPAAGTTTEEPKKKSVLEEFFGDLASVMEPKPTPVPDWPEGYERPDYVKEQEDYTDTEEVWPGPVAEIIPMPVVKTTTPSIPEKEEHFSSLKPARSSLPAISSGMKSVRMPSSSMKPIGSHGSVHFSLKKRSELRKAILANIVFSAPRAFDQSFENTTAK